MPQELLKKLPKPAQTMWESTYKTAKAKYGEERAGKIAWAAIKKKFKKVGEKWVAKSSDFKIYETVRYEFTADEASVSKSADGYSIIDYVLASGSLDGHNQKFGPMALSSMVELINEGGVVGRIDNDENHAMWEALAKKGLSPEEIEEELQKLDTGIKAIKARLDGDKVIAKVRVKNDLVDKVLGMNGASVEARFPSVALKEGVIAQARLQGFVFTPKPANADTGVAA